LPTTQNQVMEQILCKLINGVLLLFCNAIPGGINFCYCCTEEHCDSDRQISSCTFDKSSTM